MKDAALTPFLIGMGGVFGLWLPIALLMRGGLTGHVVDALVAFCFGLMGGGIFVIFLPAMLVMGFAFAFILLPIGLIRVAGGASGGAGASGEL
jgi:hypothetical protein